jgi:drug/metabolite transporter (DMT)-like permease
MLALAGAVSYGAADFAGGVASRRSHVLRVVVLSAPTSLAIAFLLIPMLGADFSRGAVVWGAVGGLASAAAFPLFYLSMAVGPMSVLSPISALTAAAIPVIAGVVFGESLTPRAATGMALAFAAVILVARGGESHGARPSAQGLLLAYGAGFAAAAQFLALHQAPHDSGLAPLVVGRAVSSVVLLAAAAFSWPRIASRPFAVLPSIAAGLLDEMANMFFLLGSRAGELSITTVIVALYPACTVGLAWFVLRERVARVQRVGLVLAAGAVSLLVLG